MKLPLRLFEKDSPLTPEAWEQFFRAGYCIARQLFDPTEITEIKSSLQRLEQKTQALAEDSKLADLTEHRIQSEGSLFVFNKEQGQLNALKRVVGCGSAEPRLLEASRKPELLHAFSDLLLSRQMEQIICQFHPKKPGDDVAFTPHRDIEHRLNYDSQWEDVNGFGSYAIGVLSVDASGPHNGGLQVVPESHLGISHTNIIKAQEDFNENWALRAFAPKLEAGDVLFMHPYLVHWSTANESRQSRMSLLSGMCCVGANRGEYPGDCTNEILTLS